ncbi:MAG: glutamine--tRNA ligase/YqeY domain fusion protein [Planctomycetes bacterium]|nr:glutamine--tRNA ligase/YqeY domain fusion protein [Planctomycetota bacterium]
MDNASNNETNENTNESLDFIRAEIADDIKNNLNDGRVHTRFPPEPNGRLHIGHAKAFCLNFSIAKEFGGKCNLRFDDTNPIKEEQEHVEAIMEDVKWIGWDWEDRLYFASDYFDQMYEWARQLIKDGKAYVCDLTPEQTREHRGSLKEQGKESSYRNRDISESLDLFEKMKNGQFPDGTRCLKAKIDMTSPNINMRDPVMYRILHATHHRTADKWCIYPMYDWAHGLEDSIEGITHSLCSLEFENHRPLYDWFIDQLNIHHPKQREFARLNLTYTVMSKRKLARLVEGNHVIGWDDPRMPTISGLRRRGYSPAAIRNFCKTIGIAKTDSTIDLALLEHCLRDNLNATSNRVMAVVNPLKVVITNYPDDQVEELEAINNPQDESAGTRKVHFTKELYIEREDFMEDAPRKFFRLSVGREVRLRYAYFVTCTDVVKDENGQVTELHCTYDPATKGGDAPDGRKVKGTIHWVSTTESLKAKVNACDNLFTKENPEATEDGQDFIDNLNPDSLSVLENCFVEKSLANTTPGDRYQFERLGYFCTDTESSEGNLVFNKTVGLRDTWAKLKKQKQNAPKKK